jgi:glycosyltransferase involved in cell wall biosynthesis
MNRKMNVCMIVHAFYLKDARVRRYAELLADTGHNVDIFCLNEGQELSYEKHKGINIYRINLSRHRGNALIYLLEYAVSFLKFFFALNNFRIRKKYDIIHVHNFPNFIVFSTLFHKMLGAKIILDIHDPVPELFMSKFRKKKNHPLIKMLMIEEKLSVKYADFVITVNDFVQKLILKRGCPQYKAAVVFNSADEKIFYDRYYGKGDATSRDHFTILYIGTIAERYGLECLIDAVAKLKKTKKIQNLQLMFIPKLKDEGSYAQLLLEKIYRCGLSDCFHLLEPVPHERMPEVIQDIDVAVYTPETDVHMNIALSLKIPEVIAMGRPMVTSRLPVLQRYFGEGALFMFKPGNADECAAKILEVYEHPEEAKLHVRQAQKALDHFSWDKQREIYLEILETLVNGSVKALSRFKLPSGSAR